MDILPKGLSGNRWTQKRYKGSEMDNIMSSGEPAAGR